MKLPADARLCEPCNTLVFNAPSACPHCGSAVIKVGAGSKYRNKPVVVDGLWFASRKEARRWQELLIMERSGKIIDLRRQHRVPIVVNKWIVCHYVADAFYREVGDDGKLIPVYEDTKSPATRRLALYQLKKKLMFACLGVAIRET